MRIIIVLLIFFNSVIIFSQDNFEKNQRYILSGGTAHIGNGEVIENSILIIENGKIVAIGPSDLVIVNKERGKTYDITGKHIYPSFILPNTTLGLAEIDAVRATRDERETGDLNPNVRTQIAYNTESIVTSTVRTNGILIAQIVPRGSLISGTSSIMKLVGRDWEEATYLKDDGIHIYWPESHDYHYHGHSHDFTASDKNDHEHELDEVLNSISLIKNLFLEAKKYSEIKNNEVDLRLQSMQGLFTGEQTLFIHVNGANGIKESVMFAKKNSIKKIVLVGASESWRVTDFISSNNIPVVLGRIHRLPNYPEDDVHQPYKTPKILKDANILFCLDYSGDMPRMGSRNLPFVAGSTVAFGLNKEEALQLITFNAAKILGIDEKTGTLETGKDANLFVSTGDALDMMGHNIELLFLMGKEVSLENHQTKLYSKFLEKFNLTK